MSDRGRKSNQADSGKRPYHRPHLYVYGDVNKLTRATMIVTGNPDGVPIAWWPGGGRQFRS